MPRERKNPVAADQEVLIAGTCQIAGCLAPRLPGFCSFFMNGQNAVTVDCD
jgi:hypothetical protein